jgi:hypothetical protein
MKNLLKMRTKDFAEELKALNSNPLQILPGRDCHGLKKRKVKMV